MISFYIFFSPYFEKINEWKNRLDIILLKTVLNCLIKYRVSKEIIYKNMFLNKLYLFFSKGNTKIFITFFIVSIDFQETLRKAS